MLTTAQRLADRSGTPHTRAMILIARSFTTVTENAWAEAYAALDEAERLLRHHCTGVSWELSLVHISRISIQRIQGHYGEAVRRGLSVLAEARDRGDIFTEARVGIFLLVDQQLLEGRFAEGRQVLRELSREWLRERFPVQQVLGFFHDINIDLLLDRRGMAWRRCRRSWPRIERTQMLRVEVIREYAFLLRGGVALAAIDDQPSQTAALIKVARSEVRRLRRLRGHRSKIFADQLEALVALRAGQPERAMALFDRCAAWFDERGYDTFAASLRHCLGRMAGGVDGERTLQAAARVLRDRGFRDPSTAVITHVPGFPRALMLPGDHS